LRIGDRVAGLVRNFGVRAVASPRDVLSRLRLARYRLTKTLDQQPAHEDNLIGIGQQESAAHFPGPVNNHGSIGVRLVLDGELHHIAADPGYIIQVSAAKKPPLRIRVKAVRVFRENLSRVVRWIAGNAHKSHVPQPGAGLKGLYRLIQLDARSGTTGKEKAGDPHLSLHIARMERSATALLQRKFRYPF
jgi:hypothetical protein